MTRNAMTQRLLRDKATASKTGTRVRNRLGSGQTFTIGGPRRGSRPGGVRTNIKVRGGR